MKPVLFVTGHVPPDRVGAFACLHRHENVELALFGGPLRHGTGPAAQPLPFPCRTVAQRDPFALACSGDYRAVVCSTGGRVALPAAWAGARRNHLPLLLWTSLWAHPRSPVHALSRVALARLYRSADAVVTYGSHVSRYVQARGARNVHEAPQAVDNERWRAPASGPPHPGWPQQSELRFLFVGRAAREKGLAVLLAAWRRAALAPASATLVLAGVDRAGARGLRAPWSLRGDSRAEGGVVAVGQVAPEELRNFYAAADVLVVPSIATRTFREPWGLVVNEAFNQQLPVIVSDSVGAAAGGLVRDGRNGLVVPAGDSAALARALRRLAADPGLRRRMGEAGARDVLNYTYEAWAAGFSRALASLGLSQRLRRGSPPADALQARW